MHEAYGLIKRWSAIGIEILNNGISDGSFRKDIALPIVREAIFGLVDSDIALRSAVLVQKDKRGWPALAYPFSGFTGAPGRIRTCGLRIRRAGCFKFKIA